MHIPAPLWYYILHHDTTRHQWHSSFSSKERNNTPQFYSTIPFLPFRFALFSVKTEWNWEEGVRVRECRQKQLRHKAMADYIDCLPWWGNAIDLLKKPDNYLWEGKTRLMRRNNTRTVRLRCLMLGWTMWPQQMTTKTLLNIFSLDRNPENICG